MDFVAPKYAANDDINADGLEQLSEVVASMGEPFKSRYTADELSALMIDTGFGEATIYSAGDVAKRFLGDNPEAYSMPSDVEALASARV